MERIMFSDTMVKPSSRSLLALDALYFVLSDVRGGLKPFLAVYLAAAHRWDPARIGIAPGPRALHRVQETVGRIHQLRRRAALHAEIPARGVGRIGLDTNQPAVLDDRDAPAP